MVETSEVAAECQTVFRNWMCRRLAHARHAVRVHHRPAGALEKKRVLAALNIVADTLKLLPREW